MTAFREAAVDRGETHLLAAMADTFPDDYARLGHQNMLTAVRLGITRAARWGFNSEPEIYLFLTLMVMLGAYFDEDPQLPWVEAHLTAMPADDIFNSLLSLHDQTMNYLDRVAGPENKALIKALVRLKQFDPMRFESETTNFPSCIADILREIYPEKANEQSDTNLLTLVVSAERSAAAQGVESLTGFGVFAGLAFMLGSGFLHDPLHPWVAQALSNTANPDVRVKNLLAQARVFIDLSLSASAAAND
jgi:hypothetical protein